MEIGRRLLFNKKTGNLIVDLGEMKGENIPQREFYTEEDIAILDLDYGQYADKFNRAENVKLNIETNELIFELIEETKTPEQQRIEELENQLLLMADSLEGGIL